MQHINFLSQLDRVVDPPFSAKHQTQLMVLMLLVLLVVYVGLRWQQSTINADLAERRAELAELSNAVDVLTAKKKAEENNPALINELAQMQSAIRFRRQLLASINPSESNQSQGFAEHLSGLARQQLQGLWFTEIVLGAQGGQMGLVGYTLKPEYLPQYIQRLSAEPVFEGQQFNVLKMSQEESRRNTLRFEMRAKDKDAGL